MPDVTGLEVWSHLVKPARCCWIISWLLKTSSRTFFKVPWIQYGASVKSRKKKYRSFQHLGDLQWFTQVEQHNFIKEIWKWELQDPKWPNKRPTTPGQPVRCLGSRARPIVTWMVYRLRDWFWETERCFFFPDGLGWSFQHFSYSWLLTSKEVFEAWKFQGQMHERHKRRIETYMDTVETPDSKLFQMGLWVKSETLHQARRTLGVTRFTRSFSLPNVSSRTRYTTARNTSKFWVCETGTNKMNLPKEILGLFTPHISLISVDHFTGRFSIRWNRRTVQPSKKGPMKRDFQENSAAAATAFFPKVSNVFFSTVVICGTDYPPVFPVPI